MIASIFEINAGRDWYEDNESTYRAPRSDESQYEIHRDKPGSGLGDVPGLQEIPTQPDSSKTEEQIRWRRDIMDEDGNLLEITPDDDAEIPGGDKPGPWVH